MTMTLDSLTHLLHCLETASDPALLQHDAQNLLLTLGPADRVAVEQALVNAGFAPEDLCHPCSAHLGLFGDAASQLKDSLPLGHVVRTMVEEHDQILGFLDELAALDRAIQTLEAVSARELEALGAIATHLINAEPQAP